APFTPAAIVEPRLVVAEHMRGEDQAVGGDSRTACRGEWLRGIDASLGEQAAEVVGRAERAVVMVEIGEGQVAGAGDVPGLDSRPRVGRAALEPRSTARVEQRAVDVAGENLLLG